MAKKKYCENKFLFVTNDEFTDKTKLAFFESTDYQNKKNKKI